MFDFLRFIPFRLNPQSFYLTQKNPSSLCLKITEKVSFTNASEAIYIYILSGQKFIENAKNIQLASFWKPEVCGQTVLPDRFNILDYSLFVCGCLIDRNRPGGLISKSCRNCRWFPLLTVGGKAVHNLLTNERWSFGVASAFVELTDLVGGNRELLLLKQLGSK